MRPPTIILSCLLLGLSVRSSAQGGIIGDIIKHIIMAIDLRIQHQQTQTIILQDAQKQIENIMQATQLDSINDWLRQQKDLYEEYYHELWEVKNVLALYAKVRQMTDEQIKIVSQCQQLAVAVRKDPFLASQEADYIQRAIHGILSQS